MTEKYKFWKIGKISLKIFKIMIILFALKNKKKNCWFYKKMFLLANFSIDTILGILFFTSRNVEVNFFKLKLF